MKPQPLRRFGLKITIVSLLCLSGAGTGSYLLYLDFIRSGPDGQGEPMAKIERREAKVRRKAASSFSWTHVQQEQNLFRKDSVQTGAASGTTIRFNDGALLELGENSLVVIDEIKQLSLDFLKGSVILRTSEGDKRITVGKDGKARFEELPIRLVSPEPLARIFTREHESKSVHFAWRVRPSAGDALAKGYMLQISPDRGFRGPRVTNLPIKNASTFEVEKALAEGIYFWRLASPDKALTEPGQFRIAVARPLAPSWPNAGERIEHFGEEAPVQFRWMNAEDSGGASHGEHTLEVARDPNFKSIVASRQISPLSGVATLNGLPNTSLHWRIRSRYSDLQISSPVERFAIVLAQLPSLKLVLPQDRGIIEVGPQVRFSWDSDSPELEFLIELQTEGGKSVISQRVATTGLLWKKPSSGAYRWRVTAFSKGRELNATPWRAFSVNEGVQIGLRAPARDQEIHYWEKPSSFVFRWDEDRLVARHPEYAYRLELSRSADSKHPEPPVKGPRLREPILDSDLLKLAPGSYSWRVIIVDASDQALKASEPSRFIYGVFPPLKPPTPQTPGANAVLNLIDEEKIPTLGWTEVQEAEGYELTVFTEGSRTVAGAAPSLRQPKVVFQKVVSKTSVELTGLQPSTYHWTVRAIDRLKRKGEPMPARAFSLTYGEILRSPEVISPEVQ